MIVIIKPTIQLIISCPGNTDGKILPIIDLAGPAKKVRITLINHNVAAIGKIENNPTKK